MNTDGFEVDMHLPKEAVEYSFRWVVLVMCDMHGQAFSESNPALQFLLRTLPTLFEHPVTSSQIALNHQPRSHQCARLLHWKRLLIHRDIRQAYNNLEEDPRVKEFLIMRGTLFIHSLTPRSNNGNLVAESFQGPIARYPSV